MFVPELSFHSFQFLEKTHIMVDTMTLFQPLNKRFYFSKVALVFAIPRCTEIFKVAAQENMMVALLPKIMVDLCSVAVKYGLSFFCE